MFRSWLTPKIESVDDTDESAHEIRDLRRVRACQALAREHRFRLLGIHRFTTRGLNWVSEEWISEDGTVQLTLNELHYVLVTRWPAHALLTSSSRLAHALPHAGFEVYGGSGEFAEDLRRHVRTSRQRSLELETKPERYASLEDTERAELRYWQEKLPRTTALRMLSYTYGQITFTYLNLLYAIGLLALTVLNASKDLRLAFHGVALSLLLLLAVSLFLCDQHKKPILERVAEEGVEDTKELSILDFKRAVSAKLPLPVL